MVEVLNIIANAATISALYALVAIGFTLIFGVGGVLNFAHGALITTGAFAAYVLANPRELAMSPWIGIVGGLVAGAIIGAVMYLGVIRFVQDRPVTVLILTFVIGFFLQHAYRIFITVHTISVSQPIRGETMFLGQSIQYFHIFIFVISWVVILCVFVFVNYTKTGKAILATSMSDRGAALVGIDADRINLYTWVIAAGLAGLAGVMLMMLQTGRYDMGTEPLVLSFAIVILGGLGSIRGSVVGAYIIGFIETITVTVIDARLQGISALLLLVTFLLVKPEGLFGREAAE